MQILVFKINLINGSHNDTIAGNLNVHSGSFAMECLPDILR